MSTTRAKISLRNQGTLLVFSFNLFTWKALTEAMANIKLDKNVIVSFQFTVADESRLLVVLQFSFAFAERIFSEKRTLLLNAEFK